MSYCIRPLSSSDQQTLREMLYHSLYVSEGNPPPARDVIRRPELSRYVEAWGRAGELGFVAYMVGQTHFDGHGVARCVAPKAEDGFIVCYFHPPPPAWQVVGVVLNAPPLLLSSFLAETLEGNFPQLCGLITFISLSIVAAGVWLQWTLMGLGAVRLVRWALGRHGRA